MPVLEFGHDFPHDMNDSIQLLKIGLDCRSHKPFQSTYFTANISLRSFHPEESRKTTRRAMLNNCPGTGNEHSQQSSCLAKNMRHTMMVYLVLNSLNCFSINLAERDLGGVGS